MGTRKVPFSGCSTSSRRISWRTRRRSTSGSAPGREVRLRYAYFVRCASVVKDPDGRGDRGALHLRSARRGAVRPGRPQGRGRRSTGCRRPMRCRRRSASTTACSGSPIPRRRGTGSRKHLNPGSLETVNGFIEASLANAAPGSTYQFERLGYFCVDAKDSPPGRLVFNRVVALRDSWAKLAGAAT